MSPAQLRVLFLTESFHPVLGGGEQHLRRLGARLVASGVGATVVTRQSEPSWAREELVDGIRVRRVPPPGPGRTGKYAMVPAAMAALRREARDHHVVVVRGTRVLGLPGLLASRWLGRPVVLQAEVNGEMSGEVYTWGTLLRRRPLRDVVAGLVRARNAWMVDADAFVAMSRRIRDECLAAGVPGPRVALIPHGVDTTHFRPAAEAERGELRRRLGLPDGTLIGYTGRLLRGKGLEALVDAFARLAPDHPGARLVLVGSGAGQSLSVEDALRARVRAAGLDARCLFTGRIDDVADHLRACDVFAFPSAFEALGLSLVEAAACGLPAVGSRTGGIVDVIEDGGSGLLVEPHDVPGLEAALRRLLAEPARRAVLGARAREVARSRFDLDDSVDRYRSLFFELARRR